MHSPDGKQSGSDGGQWEPRNGGEDCCAGPCSGPEIRRRRFLQAAGLGLASATPLGAAARGAQPQDAAHARAEHERLIPPEKRLPPEWVRQLTGQGARVVYRGRELETIAMPIGGIAAGQLYLCGDGTLGCWYIFNKRFYSGAGAKSYRRRIPDSPVAQGFAIQVEAGGRRVTRPLNGRGFREISFVGEYPIARVSYRDAAVPLAAEMEAFSPFIPLNADDSALPATLFHLTVENTSGEPVRVRTAGWLENAVCFYTAARLRGLRDTSFVRQPRRSLMCHGARGESVSAPASAPARPTIVLADFEGPNYGEWIVTGEAFGTGPARGTLPAQNSVLGFMGKGLVNTHIRENAPQGTLTSPPFEIARRYINFLVGGGSHAGRTCVNLLIDGKAVRTATGDDGEPLAWNTWDVGEFAGRQGRIEILDLESGSWGHINVDQIELSDTPRRAIGRVEETDDYGSMVLGHAGAASPAEETLSLMRDVEVGELPVHAEDATPPIGQKYIGAIASQWIDLAPGQRHTFTYVLAWHFPNRKTLGQDTGHAYAARFRDAPAVAGYVLDHHERLAGQTRLWHATYYDSTLPHWLLDRVGSTLSCLASCTCELWKNGRFWAWEGVYCCPGTCTHVWNYAHGAARLFPSLERSVREMQDLSIGLQAGGLVGFRGEHNVTPAADGQMGTILKCWREHLCSPDVGFLRRNWAAIRKTIEYALRMDGNADGLVEGEQHNTFDIEFFGANTFVGSLYLAALRAGEAMAREMGEAAFADRLNAICERGRELTMERLWNGEYFIQRVDLDKHPQNQYADGCLSDQLFGQGWAHQVGLGYLYPREAMTTALRSIWRYNWAPDVGPYSDVHKPARSFAEAGEAGLLTCTWPLSPYMPDGVRFKDEVWTGIEYQVAGHMIWEGLLTEGLATVRAIHDRYQAMKRNPYNEVECGDHYARALASWGVLTALTGFSYHGPRGEISFAPRLTPEAFRSVFTTAEAWGTFSQKRHAGRQENNIQVRHGRLRLKQVSLAAPRDAGTAAVAATLSGRSMEVSHTVREGTVIVELAEVAVLNENDVLKVTVG